MRIEPLVHFVAVGLGDGGLHRFDVAKLRLLIIVSSVTSVANTFANKRNRQNIIFQRFVN